MTAVCARADDQGYWHEHSTHRVLWVYDGLFPPGPARGS